MWQSFLYGTHQAWMPMFLLIHKNGLFYEFFHLMCPLHVCVMKGGSLLRFHLSQIASIFLMWLKCDCFKWILVNIVLTWCSSAQNQIHYAVGMLLYRILGKTISANNSLLSSSVNRSQNTPIMHCRMHTHNMIRHSHKLWFFALFISMILLESTVSITTESVI